MSIGGKLLSFWTKCGPTRTFLMFETEHSLRSKQNIPFRSRTFRVFEARHSLCSKQDIPCVRSTNFKRLKNREDSSDFDDFWTESIATTRTFFSKIFAPPKFSRRRKISRRTSERTYERTNDRASKSNWRITSYLFGKGIKIRNFCAHRLWSNLLYGSTCKVWSI